MLDASSGRTRFALGPRDSSPRSSADARRPTGCSLGDPLGEQLGEQLGETPPREPWGTLLPLRPVLLKFLRSRCRDPHLAEDLAHDTMLRATRYPAALERVDRPRAWLVQMAANVHRDHARRRARYQLTPPDDPGFLGVEGTEPHPGEPGSTDFYLIEGQRVDGDVLAREMRASWGGLPERDQTVLDAYYGEEGGTGRAARSCGIDPGLVKVRLFRARRRLEAAVRARVDLG